MKQFFLALFATLAIFAAFSSVSSQCAGGCSGATPICVGSDCVACTSQSQCWDISDNLLSCNISTGECGACVTSKTCPEALPICSKITKQCASCNASAECNSRVPGTFCDADLGTCEWCISDANCTGYGSGYTCVNSTGVGGRCTAPGISGLPDPNNLNGVITAYTIISIVIFLLFIMFIVCACTKDEDYGPSHVPETNNKKAPPASGTRSAANGTHSNKEIELTEKKPKKVAK